MNKYVSLDKRSKKAQREYHAKQRRTWGELNKGQAAPNVGLQISTVFCFG